MGKRLMTWSRFPGMPIILEDIPQDDVQELLELAEEIFDTPNMQMVYKLNIMIENYEDVLDAIDERANSFEWGVVPMLEELYEACLKHLD
jgi:hypothetical protein